MRQVFINHPNGQSQINDAGEDADDGEEGHESVNHDGTRVSKKLFAKCFYLNVKPRRFPAYKLFPRWRNVGIVCGRNIFRSIGIVVNFLGKFPKTSGKQSILF